MNKLTLVSFILDSPDENTLISQCMAFRRTNICVVLYATQYAHQILQPFCVNNNILLMPPIDIQCLWIHEIYESNKFRAHLPNRRNREKDTEIYILSRHAKHELLENIITMNPWKSTHFVWTDCDIFYRCKNIESVANYFQWLNTCHWRENVLTMMGGWSALTRETDVLESPYWRFCGALMGDSKSILDFCKLYRRCLQDFLVKHQKWVWEFNVWAWMEYTCGEQWKVVWYPESPDIDELFVCSADHYTTTITPIQKIDYMDYKIPNFYASSSSHIEYQGEHYLNTRFINYWIANNGNYLFQDGSQTIKNKNVFTQFNMKTYSPESHREMNENITMNHVLCSRPISIGLEDMRLFEYRGKIHYIATTIGYTSNGKARIMMGEYNIEQYTIDSGTIIEPPKDTFCEKNWVPIVKGDDLFFIYKWHPYQIGKRKQSEEGTYVLEIIESSEIPNLIFRKIRGSSPFVKTERGLLGVVHFSENYTPRHYYHMMVLLDEHTLRVKEYSNTFCFEKLGIEFCIGFSLDTHKKYVFWISRHDRDPCVFTISSDAFVFSTFSNGFSTADISQERNEE